MLYFRIYYKVLEGFPEEFKKKKNAARRVGHITNKNILDSIRLLATGRSFDDLDDTAKMSEESITKACVTFAAT